jgi:hypothetical protein
MALANLSKSSNTCRETLINNDGLEPIIPLLSSTNPKLQQQALYIVDILSSSDKFCAALEKQVNLYHY